MTDMKCGVCKHYLTEMCKNCGKPEILHDSRYEPTSKFESSGSFVCPYCIMRYGYVLLQDMLDLGKGE